MKRRVLWLVAIGAGLAVAGFVVVASGVIPVKASSGHWPMTNWLLQFAMQRSVATHSLGIEVPQLDEPALVLKGARHYDVGCRSCHGAPGQTQPRIAASMLPPPPDLPPRIEASNPQKLFFVVKHGIKFTGMPAWPSQKRDDEVWAMVAFLLKMPELDEAGYHQLVHGESVAAKSIKALDSPSPSEIPTAAIQSCAQCHGADGRESGGGAFPKLAGQRVGYLEHALRAYAYGQRHSGMMEPVAAGLKEEEIRQLARYYSSLGRTEVPASPLATTAATPTLQSSAEAVARGRAIALDGIAHQRVPSCVECHGPGATRGKPEYPALAGQPADYLQLQLQLFKREQRGGSAYAHLMRPVATRLTDEQMRDVALYFESLADPKNPVSETSRSGR